MYRVREVGQSGWVQTTVNPGDATVVSGTNATGMDFGNFQLGEIRGQKFRDTDGDGQRAADGSEPGLAGWTIFLDVNSNGALDGGEPATTTDTAGGYAFDGLAAGTYRVREVGQPGWIQTTVNPGDVTVLSGAVVTGIDFGNFQLGASPARSSGTPTGTGPGTPASPGWPGGRSSC